MVEVVEEHPEVAKEDGAMATQGDMAAATRQTLSMLTPFDITTIIPNNVASLVQLHCMGTVVSQVDS